MKNLPCNCVKKIVPATEVKQREMLGGKQVFIQNFKKELVKGSTSLKRAFLASKTEVLALSLSRKAEK